jgi:choline-sulfatase
VALGLGACSQQGSTSLPEPGAAAGFNVLVVTFDTTRADRIGCYGAGADATPTVDRLASRGVRFMHATAVTPLTMPSHSSLFTGRTPPNHGVRDNGLFVLPEHQTSLAELLHDEGYQTAAFVSAFVLNESFGLDQGFDLYDDEVDPAELQGAGGHDTRRRGDKTAARAATWLSARPEDQPWLAWVHLFDPHAPYTPHPDLIDSRSAYEAEITYADQQLARVIAAIEKRGELERTLILFTADHGESLGEHKEKTHGLLAYDGTMQVPLILSCPTLFASEIIIDDTVASLVDVTPTLLALLGLGRPADIDGEFLFAQLGPDRAVYFEALGGYYQHGWAPLRGLRRVNDKLIDGVDPEYYDLETDPAEDINRFTSPASLELQEQLVNEFGPFDEVPRATEQETSVDPRVAAQLNALGYAHSVDASERGGQADPKHVIVNWNRTASADDLSRAGQHDRARAKIARVLESDGENGHAWWTAAVIARRSGNLDQAENCVRRSLEFRPDASARVLLAQLLLVRGELDESLAELALAEAADTRLGGIYVTRGEIFLRRGHEEEARVEFERGAEIDPSNWGTRARARIESLSGSER